MDQLKLIEELRRSHFPGMTEFQQVETLNSYKDRYVYAWGNILSIDENYIHLNAQNSKEEFSVACEYKTKFKRENLNLNTDEFICVKMKINKVSMTFYNDCEIWSLHGFYDGLSVKKVNFYQRLFETRSREIQDGSVKMEKVKTKKEIKEEKGKEEVPVIREAKVKSKKQIDESTIKRYESENRMIEKELEDHKAQKKAFRRAALLSVFFLFCASFYELHEGHHFFDGINFGTIAIAAIIGIIVFIRSNM